MSEEQKLSPWITQWQTNGTPAWAIERQTVQRVTNTIEGWFRSLATVEERLEAEANDGVSETFDAEVEAKFPGVFQRLADTQAEYERLRSFDPMTKEDLMVKNADDTLAFQALCDANIRVISIKGNEIFGKQIFEVPVEQESHDDTPETSAPTSYKKGS